MAPQRLSKSRFNVEEEASSPRVSAPVKGDDSKNLGLTQVDSTIAIGQSGGLVVVMQELHDESAFDTGDFAVSKSRFDKRKDAQKERDAEARRKKEEERKAALALKKEQEAQAAREAAAAKETARKAAEEERKRKEQEEKKQKEAQKKESKANRGPVPAPPPVPSSEAPEAPVEKKPSKGKGKRKGGDVSEASKVAILQDSAVVGIGNIISSKPVPKLPVVVEASVQTDPVRILPVEQSPKVAPTSTSAAAAWWLQQAATGAAAPPAQVSQPAPQTQSSGDQYMMQAYIDAMQRMSAPAQPSSYGYWTAPATQAPSAADMYWQQQQNVYQTAPRYNTAPRRLP